MVCHNIVFSKPDYVCSNKNAKVSFASFLYNDYINYASGYMHSFLVLYCFFVIWYRSILSGLLLRHWGNCVMNRWNNPEEYGWINHMKPLWRQQNNAPKTYVYLRHLVMWPLFCYILYGLYSIYVPCLKKVTDDIMNECRVALGVCKYMNYCRCIASIGFARQAVLPATLCI